MAGLFQLIGYFALVFALSMGAAWFITTVKIGKYRVSAPPENSLVRIRATSGMYRSRFVGASRQGWILTAPLSRDHYVPLRIEETLTIEAPTEDGVYLFRTKIVERDEDSHQFTIKKPASVSRIDRRDEPRLRDLASLTIHCEGLEAWVVDLSPGGAKVCAKIPRCRGERVRLDLPWLEDPVFAWVLDVAPANVDGGKGVEMRMRFEQLLDIAQIKRRTAPVA